MSRPLILVLGFALASFFVFRSPEPNLPRIGITQIVEHSSLNEERKGMEDFLSENGYVAGKTVIVDYQNAHGNVATARQIVQQFASQKATVVFALSTPSAQAALPICAAHKIPLVFSAVSDPVSAKLVADLDHPGDSVTGVSDHLSASQQINFIKTFMPTLRRIAVLYNPGEVNSVQAIKEFKEEAAKQSITVIEGTATKTSDIALTVQSVLGNVEAIYIPTDNTFISSIQTVMKTAGKIPVWTGDLGSVQSGATGTSGYSRYELGKKAGAHLLSVLKGKTLHPVDREHTSQIYLNRSAFEQTGLTIPDGIKITWIPA